MRGIMMTDSRITVNNIDGRWCWSVSVNGPLGINQSGKTNDFNQAYEDAFNVILDAEREGVPDSIYPMLKVLGLVVSITLPVATYLGVF
tara:strand:- start:14169 stop:14435 length:267 start_codon:yes stop_codon:yes gene_type:complete